MNFFVIGNPVKHSLSPALHHYFAQRSGLQISYSTIAPAVDAFSHCVHQLMADGATGANVTLPFKLQAMQIADEATPIAQQAQAANTLKFVEGRCLVDNTDGRGFLQGYATQVGWKSETVLVLGAGGAAFAIAWSLAQSGALVLIHHRSIQKAKHLVSRLQHPAILVFSDEMPTLPTMVVNATSASLAGVLPEGLPKAHHLKACLRYIDLVYTQEEMTPFTEWALQNSPAATVADGWNMFVEQGALSFEWWTGLKPDTEYAKQNRQCIFTG